MEDKEEDTVYELVDRLDDIAHGLQDLRRAVQNLTTVLKQIEGQIHEKKN